MLLLRLGQPICPTLISHFLYTHILSTSHSDNLTYHPKLLNHINVESGECMYLSNGNRNGNICSQKTSLAAISCVFGSLHQTQPPHRSSVPQLMAGLV